MLNRDQIKEAVAQGISLHLQKNKLSIRKLAAKSGIPHSTLACYLSGLRLPDLEQYLKMTAAGISFQDLQN